MRRVEVVIPLSQLKRDVYLFWYNDSLHQLSLIDFTREERATTRHKFRAVDMWSQHHRRHVNIPRPEIDRLVASMAIQQFTQSLTVGFNK